MHSDYISCRIKSNHLRGSYKALTIWMQDDDFQSHILHPKSVSQVMSFLKLSQLTHSLSVCLSLSPSLKTKSRSYHSFWNPTMQHPPTPVMEHLPALHIRRCFPPTKHTLF